MCQLVVCRFRVPPPNYQIVWLAKMDAVNLLLESISSQLHNQRVSQGGTSGQLSVDTLQNVVHMLSQVKRQHAVWDVCRALAQQPALESVFSIAAQGLRDTFALASDGGVSIFMVCG